MSRSSANDGKNSVSNIGGFYDSRARLSNQRDVWPIFNLQSTICNALRGVSNGRMEFSIVLPFLRTPSPPTPYGRRYCRRQQHAGSIRCQVFP